jgi:hypothetical protein
VTNSGVGDHEALGLPEWLIEIDGLAVIPDDSAATQS